MPTALLPHLGGCPDCIADHYGPLGAAPGDRDRRPDIEPLALGDNTGQQLGL